ncbi:MAG TPA: FtsX-like permease family protein [Candidatus Dormibacteraeota bacterium]|nr:FtsX-like permease family protein [Candidatus Dormibacteraeota bacterium]
MTSYFGIPPSTVATWMVVAVAVVFAVLLGLAAVNRVLLRMALRNVPRRRAQTVLILFGLMLATLIITTSLAIGDTSAYSLQAIQLRQIGGIDEAITRVANENTVQGAGTADGDFFNSQQAGAAMAAARSDPNVAAAAGAIVAPGSMIDTASGQVSAENVAIFGVGPDFGAVWGPLRGGDGRTFDVSALGDREALLGDSLGRKLNARAGDELQLYIAGQPLTVTVRGVLDTEVNPSISNHGPIVNSVLLPLATMRTALARPQGFNLIFVHNQGSGGLDDLGPSGARGDEVTRRLRAAFTDQQAALDLRAFLETSTVKGQIRQIHDQASFLDPGKDLSAQLLAELDKPTMTDEFKSLAGDRFVQRIVFQAATQSVPPSKADEAGQQVNSLLSTLQIDTPAAAELKSMLTEPSLNSAIGGVEAMLPASDPSRKALADLLTEAQRPTLTPEFKLMIAGEQNLVVKLLRAAAPTQVARFQQVTGLLDLFVLNAYKSDAVIFAEEGGLVATGALLAVSFFSIAVGVLLIFLIFVMLAAERRAEMGMSRAVGLKRRHLTQMFLFEGAAYTLAASIVGVVLGVLVGYVMSGVLSTVFSSFYSGLALQYHVEWTSLVIAFCLGILLTFVVVAVSAYRVSRLNIVAAIRDLDESESRDAGMRRMFTAVFVTIGRAARQLAHGHPLVFLNRITLGTLGAIKTFWWALFRRGPMTISLGAGLMYVGVTQQVEVVYTAGVSLVIVGAGLLVRWILTASRVRYVISARVGFTAAALGLLVYWGRPFGRVENLLHIDKLVQLDRLNGGAEVFVLSALMTLLGAIWLVMFNSDLLIRAVMFFTGRIGSLAPITRTSMAYPMSTKFRTGMAVAMFGIVTFMVVFMSVFQDVLVQNFAQVDQLSGGWQLVAGTPDNNFNQTPLTTFPTDIATVVSSNPAAAADVKSAGWEDNSMGVALQQVQADGTVRPFSGGRTDYMGLHVVDAGFLSSTTFGIAPRAAGYSSDRAVWDAVRDHPGYAVVDASTLDASNGRAATIAGIRRSDASFQPFQVELNTFAKGPGATPSRVTIIGFIPQSNWNGMYMSTQTAIRSGLLAPPAASDATLPAEQDVLRPTGYYFSVKPGVDVNKARLDLGRLLAPDQLEPIVVADQLQQQVGGFLLLLRLMTGFLALGLIVGIAGLGVISTRAVVERWQQIGMLRALGYRRSLVQRSFLMESSFIAIIGLAIGALVGVWQSYRFFVIDQAFGTVDFHVPALEILLILVGSYLATLLTTFLPARAAARVAPAEALRYE